MTETVKNGMFVSLTYSISEQNGSVIEQNDLPSSYIHGGDMELIGGMDRALLGKRAGDRVQFDISSEQAGFGEYDDSLIFTDDINNVPPQFRQLGAEVSMQNESGETRSFYVRKIENGTLTIDGNHPLAGKNLRVNIEIREVRKATKDDLVNITTISPTLN